MVPPVVSMIDCPDSFYVRSQAGIRFLYEMYLDKHLRADFDWLATGETSTLGLCHRPYPPILWGGVLCQENNEKECRVILKLRGLCHVYVINL